MELKTENLDKSTLAKIETIDNSFYTTAITGIGWYLERYSNKHKAILLYDDDNICVGYLTSVPIKKVLYDALLNGVLTNDLHINPKMFIEKSDYNYIASSVILNEYRHKGYGKQMLDKLFSENSGKYVALTVSKDGFNLVKDCMELKIQIDNNTYVFEKHIK